MGLIGAARGGVLSAPIQGLHRHAAIRPNCVYDGIGLRASSARMKPFHSRVIQVVFESVPDLKRPWRGRTRIAAVILYPSEVERLLVTVGAARGRALTLARQIIKRDLFRPPILETLRCSVEVVEYDLRPFMEPHWRLEDGTKVWVAEVERVPDWPSWPAR